MTALEQKGNQTMFYKPVIFLISGNIGAGKTTISSMLASMADDDEYCSRQTSFATSLKYICKTSFGWNGIKDEKGRKLLQNIGISVRDYDEDTWVKHLCSALDCLYGEYNFIIIDDFRFQNEFNYIRNTGIYDIITVRIERESVEKQGHVSERSLDGFNFDLVVKNNGTLEDLKESVRDVYGYALSKYKK